ncbi:hypothetical protein VTN00DRAFT_2789 [Thermoascus crustaceus]|uniref:uncharacterized protein n=1 Tax=Thermoascus crustaceus TaxID=5088 RepID=UPI0037425406
MKNLPYEINGGPVNGTSPNGEGDATPRDPTWVPVSEQPVFTPRKLKVICVGAGYSGLMLAYKYKYETPMDDYVDLTIYEKNHDVGGTWLENRYPGVACDVPAHIYTFSFEPNPDWSCFYSSGPEIWEYIKRTTVKYGLDEKVQFNSKVIETVWDESSGKWRVKVDQQGTIIETEADVLVNAAGILNKWCWPDIPGIDTYKGKKVHSARWDPDLDWAGKRVAIIGNGSSAIQILPQMQKTAGHTTTYVRSPTWITPNFAAHLARDGKNFEYTEEEKRRFREEPRALFEYRKNIEHNFNKFFYTFLKDSPDQQAAFEACTESMQQGLNHDDRLCEKIIPKWPVGCRRATPGEGYLEALCAKNVDVESDKIIGFTENGIKTAAGEREFDIVVCATGFDVSFTPYWKLVGKNGVWLADQWKDIPEAYFGICAANMPNYFIFNGPNCPAGHGSLLAVMEWTAEYILRWCRKIAKQDIKSVTVKPDVVHEYNVYSQEYLKRTVFTGGCRSWYQSRKDGRVTAMYGGSVLHYKENLEEFRTEDFEFEYRSPNRFRFLGNGLTIREKEGGDLGFYVKK